MIWTPDNFELAIATRLEPREVAFFQKSVVRKVPKKADFLKQAKELYNPQLRPVFIMRLLAIAAACAFSVAGCTDDTSSLDRFTLANVLLKSPEQLAGETKNRADKSENSVVYWSPPINDSGPSIASNSEEKLPGQLARNRTLRLIYNLKTWKYGESSITKHQLTVIVMRPEFAEIMYRKATDDDGLSLEVVHRYDGNAICVRGWCSQFLGINLELSYLLHKRNTGLEIMLNSSKGTNTLSVRVPRNYVKGHLMAIGAL